MSGSATHGFWELLSLGLGPAVLTAAVALLSPRLTEGRKQKAEKEKRRAEKFEELVGALFEHKHWLDQYMSTKIFGDKIELGVSPMAKVVTISNIYFPNFKEQIAELDIVSSKFEISILEAGKKRLSNEENYTSGSLEAAPAYFEKHSALMKELTAYAQKEFQ